MKIDFSKCFMWNGTDFLLGVMEDFEGFKYVFEQYHYKGIAIFAQDTGNNIFRSGWVNEHGNQIGNLHYEVYDFKGNFAKFYDIDDLGNAKFGYIDKCGIEYYTGDNVKDAKLLQKYILKWFPINSMKFYLLLKFTDNLLDKT